MAAFSAKDDVTYNGDIIVKFDGFFAIGTKRIRFYNRFTPWYPVYADVEETADDSTEYKNYYRDHIHLLCVTLFV